MELRMKADGLSPLGSTKRPPWAKVAREDVLLGLAGIREISSYNSDSGAPVVWSLRPATVGYFFDSPLESPVWCWMG